MNVESEKVNGKYVHIPSRVDYWLAGEVCVEHMEDKGPLGDLARDYQKAVKEAGNLHIKHLPLLLNEAKQSLERLGTWTTYRNNGEYLKGYNDAYRESAYNIGKTVLLRFIEQAKTLIGQEGEELTQQRRENNHERTKGIEAGGRGEGHPG